MIATPRKPRVLIVSGSTSETGLTGTVLGLVDALVRQRGVDTEFISVRSLPLPLYGLQDEAPVNAAIWRDTVDQASAVILGSPEYHGSFSGALKNHIDYLESPQVRGKPAALVAAAGSARSGIATLGAMRLMLRSLHVSAIVEQVAAWKGDFMRDGRTPNSALLDYLTVMVDALVRELDRYVRDRRMNIQRLGSLDGMPDAHGHGSTPISGPDNSGAAVA
jgi:azobenzene reductase